MLKILGCFCVFAASSGMAYTCVISLRRELRRMEQLMDLLWAVQGELSYLRCPLPELLHQLSGHMPQPYSTLLMQGSSRMEKSSEADIPALWEDVCGLYRTQLGLPAEAYEVLQRIGEAFAYSSLEASLQLLRLWQKKLDFMIESRRKEFSSRKKIYCCLCYMAGLFSMIILL